MVPKSHRLLRALLILVLSLAPAPAFADAASRHVVSACDRGMFDLDCGCVAAQFEAAAQGASGPERGTLAGLTGTMLGIEPDPALMDMSVFVAVAERLNALEDLTEVCAATSTPASQLSQSAIDAEVAAIRRPATAPASTKPIRPPRLERTWNSARPWLT